MRRTMLLSILALTIGCEPQIDQSAQPLAVYPIPGLPAYDGGRILHPCGTCWDVAMMYDPDGSPAPVPNWLGIPVVTLPSGLYDQPLHQATCLR